MPDDTPLAENSGGPATALADPPAQPPTTPPGAVGAATPEPGRRRRGIWLVAMTVGVAMLLLCGVLFILVRAFTGSGSSATPSQTKSAFESAMSKAGVTASYPSSPVDLTNVVPTGSHPFSATFTPDEVAALLNTFPFDFETAGIQIQVRNSSVSIPAAGTVAMSASVTVNGGTYSGSFAAPVTYEKGRITTTGLTKLDVSGIPTNAAQKQQVGDSLVAYFNSYLRAAPGLRITSAQVSGDGFVVTGVAPNSIAYK